MRILLVIISIVVVTLTIGTIIVGNRIFDGIVVERPYEAGLSWDETQKRQDRLGWNIAVDKSDLKLGKNEIILRITNRDASPLDEASVSVTVSRPSTRAYDRTYRAVPMGGGRYRASISVPVIGIWDLRTEVTRTGDLYTAVERIEASE